MTNQPQVFSKACLINHLCRILTHKKRRENTELLIIDFKHMVPLIAFRCNYGADYFSLGTTPITDGSSSYLEHYEAISPKITWICHLFSVKNCS